MKTGHMCNRRTEVTGRCDCHMDCKNTGRYWNSYIMSEMREDSKGVNENNMTSCSLLPCYCLKFIIPSHSLHLILALPQSSRSQAGLLISAIEWNRS